MPEFRAVVHRIQVVRGEQHYHVHLLAPRGDVWAVCGVLLLHSEEWARFSLVCEVVSIEIQNEAPVSS